MGIAFSRSCFTGMIPQVNVAVKLLSHILLFATPGTAACQASLSSLSPGVCSNSCPLSRLYHPTNCRPLLLLPSIFSSIRVFSNELALRIRCPKYWSFSFSISPSSEYSGLISVELTDLISLVQGTHKSLLQHHNRWTYYCQRRKTHSSCGNPNKDKLYNSWDVFHHAL